MSTSISGNSSSDDSSMPLNEDHSSSLSSSIDSDMSASADQELTRRYSSVSELNNFDCVNLSTTYPIKKREAKMSEKSTDCSYQTKKSLFNSLASSDYQNQSSTSSVDKVFERAQAMALKYKGECLSSHFSISKGKNSLKFKCLNGHTFYVSADAIPAVISQKSTGKQDDCWCHRCKKFYDNCQ